MKKFYKKLAKREEALFQDCCWFCKIYDSRERLLKMKRACVHKNKPKRYRENEREEEGEEDDREKAARNLCLRNIGGYVEHLKHRAVARIGRLRVPYRVSGTCALRLATSIRETTGYYHRRCIILSLLHVSSLWWQRRLQPVVTWPASRVRSVLSSPRLLTASPSPSPRPGSLASSVPLILFYLPRFPICLGIFILFCFLSNFSLKFSHIFALPIYFFSSSYLLSICFIFKNIYWYYISYLFIQRVPIIPATKCILDNTNNIMI